MKKTFTLKIGDRPLILETGELAQQANGSVLARYGDTVVLATVCSSSPKEDLGYFPLSVDYEEKLYAGGRIKGSRFIKREGKPSDRAVLNGRLIDRSIRPLFPPDFFNEVHLVITVLSIDQDNDPEILAAIAASSALAISDIPWSGPIGTVRVGIQDGNFILNPDNERLENSDLDLVVSGTKEAVIMIESGAKEISEEQIVGGIEFAQKEIQKIVSFINEIVKEVGKTKMEYEPKEIEEKIKKAIMSFIEGEFSEDYFEGAKEARRQKTGEIKEKMYVQFEGKISKDDMDLVYEEFLKKKLRAMVIDNDYRINQRKMNEVRSINVQVGVLPRTHGSAIFERGETQIMTIATLGSTSLEQLIERMEGEIKKGYMHHYNFPPFSVGEAGRMGPPRRREIGHGALAEKALTPVIPEQEEFPYTIRLVSETLSSAGSTSMGATCGSSLALMDAGVPIKASVSGIAMGIIFEGEKYQILSDIQEAEDFYGDMDLKVAGTEKGVTALQMDVKTLNLTPKILKEALLQAKEGRKYILDQMLKVISTPRGELSEYAPRAEIIHIDPKKIGEVIGPGGKIINQIIEATSSTIDIDDDGTVSIAAEDTENLKKAVDWVKGITEEAVPGQIYKGKVVRIVNFGAFVEILPGKEGLLHISEIAPYRIQKVEDELSVDQEVEVKVLNIDEMGRINLTLMLDKDINQASSRRNSSRRNFQSRNNRFRKDRPGEKKKFLKRK